MVEHQLRRRGIFDERVLDAMARVPRERLRSRGASSSRLRGQCAPDRQRPDDLAALHGRDDLLAARAHRRRARARRRHGVRLPGGRARRAGGRGRDDRTRPRARRAGESALVEAGYADVEVLVGDGSLGAPRPRALRRASRSPRPRRPFLRRCRTADRGRATRRPAGWPLRAAARARRTHRGRPPRAPERLVQVRAAPRRRGVFGWRLLAQWGVDASAPQATLGQSWRPRPRTFG